MTIASVKNFPNSLKKYTMTLLDCVMQQSELFHVTRIAWLSIYKNIC